MSLFAFLLILASTILHATWNLVAKKSHFSIPFYVLMESTCFLCWGHAIFWSPIPFGTLPLAFWQATCLAAFCDLFYGVGIQYSYEKLEMSVAYPVMRSLPLLFTAILTSAFGWGERLSWMVMLSMAVVFSGCIIIPLARFRDFSLKAYCNKGFFFVFIVACGITGYTLFDARALSVLRNAYPDASAFTVSLTYYTFRMIALISFMGLMTVATKKNRALFRNLFRERHWIPPMLAGTMASTTFALVLCAMNYVTNVAYVQAFRQIGLIIGMLEGIFFLKEKATLTKAVGMSLIILGLVASVLAS